MRLGPAIFLIALLAAIIITCFTFSGFYQDFEKINGFDVRSLVQKSRNPSQRASSELAAPLPQQTPQTDHSHDPVIALVQVKELHRTLCMNLCGARYDYSEMRNAFQTAPDPALVCIDGNADLYKNNMIMETSRHPDICTEVHGGSKGAWCIAYNKTYQGRNYGAYVQCVGLLPP